MYTYTYIYTYMYTYLYTYVRTYACIISTYVRRPIDEYEIHEQKE
jgi:hypothetical protein